MSVTMLFSKHASPEAIRAELRKARWAVVVAQKHVHSLECLLERREMEIADGSWPANAQVASAESMMEAYRTEAHAMTERAEAAEAQRDTLIEALEDIVKRQERGFTGWVDLTDMADIARAALAGVAPLEAMPDTQRYGPSEYTP